MDQAPLWDLETVTGMQVWWEREGFLSSCTHFAHTINYYKARDWCMGTMGSFTDKVTACTSQLSEKNTAFLLRHFNSVSFLFPRTETTQSQLTAGVFRWAKGPLSFRLASLRPDLLQSRLFSIHTQPSDKAICCSHFLACLFLTQKDPLIISPCWASPFRALHQQAFIPWNFGQHFGGWQQRM